MDLGKLRNRFYLFLHLNYIVGFIYAFARFISTPRATLGVRRLWAYECWIILSFYFLLFYLILIEREKAASLFSRFKKLLAANLLLLIFPWGIFLIFAPRSLLLFLSLGSIYWRFLGIFSLLGAIVYYFPYRFYKNKLTYPILIFGFFDKAHGFIPYGFVVGG